MSDETVTEVVEEKQPGVEEFNTKASKEAGAREITMKWNIGKDVQESVDMFGAEVVHGTFRKGIIVAVQAPIRRMLDAKNEDGSLKFTDEQIVNFVHNEYKPGVRSARVGGGSAKSMEKLIAEIMKLPKEKRLAALAEAGLEL